MNSAIERLLSLRVGDVMAKNVVTVSTHQTMTMAASILVEKDLSGAPVVDEMGHCVGVLSANDYMKWQSCRCGDGVMPGLREGEHRMESVAGEPFRIAELTDDLVEDHMTPGVKTISAERSLLDAGRVMCTGHLHRVVVLDEKLHPIGIISSLDIVAALVKAIEE